MVMRVIQCLEQRIVPGAKQAPSRHSADSVGQHDGTEGFGHVPEHDTLAWTGCSASR